MRCARAGRARNSNTATANSAEARSGQHDFRANTANIHFIVEHIDRGTTELPSQPRACGAAANDFVRHDVVNVIKCVEMRCRKSAHVTPSAAIRRSISRKTH